MPTVKATTWNWAGWTPGESALALLVGGFGLSLCLITVYQPILLLALILAGMLAFLVFSRTSLCLKFALLLGGIPLESLGASDVNPTQKPLLAGLGGTTVDGICLVVLSICFAMLLLSSGRLSVPRGFRPYLYFVGFIAVSLLYSDSRLDGLRLVLKVAYPVLVFLVTAKAITTQREIDSAFHYWIAGGLVATISGAAVFLVRGATSFMFGGDFRYSSGLLYASPFSMYMFALFGLCYGLWRGGRGGRYGVLGAIFGVQALIAETRITWAALLVGVLVIEGLMGQGTRKLLRVAGAVVLIGIASFYVMQNSIGLQRRLFGGELDPGSSVVDMAQDINLSGRSVVWALTSADYWSHNRWIGQGAGSSGRLLAATFDEASVPHNEYLRILHDTGIVGLALFLAGIIGLFRLLRPLLNKNITEQQRICVKVALALLAGYGIVAISDNPLDYYLIFSQYVFFIAAVALAAFWGTNDIRLPQ